VHLVTRKRSALAALTVGAVVLGACGTGGASHVVRPSQDTGAVSSVPDATAAVGSQSVSQIDAELGVLDTTLNQANADLANPGGDS
jgi:hypothetical protein